VSWVTDRAKADRSKTPKVPKSPRPLSQPAVIGGPSAVLRLQAMAGNGAVAALVAQRLDEGPTGGPGAGGCAAPPVEPAAMRPSEDPAFTGAQKDIDAKARGLKAHPTPAKEVGDAQSAAVAPPDDKEAQAKAAHTEKMDAAKPGGFDKAAFIAAVNAAVAAKAPKNLDEADKFAQSGKADQVKNEVMGKVAAGKDTSAKAIKDTTEATPDQGAARDKPVTPLPPTQAPSVPTPPDPKALAAKPAPAEQLRLGGGSCETDKQMTEAGVTEPQLAKSNEPQFNSALEAKKTAEVHSATAPAEVLAREGEVIAGATAGAGATTQAGLGAMTATKGAALQSVGAGKESVKSKDEGERTRIAGDIKKIFDTTKTDVEKILGNLDGEVGKRFEDGERKAKEAFTADHEARMSKYKWSRYGGPGGAALWIKDQFLDLPAEANDIFVTSKKVYETRMQGVIGEIADFVGAELGRAKARVAEGRAQVQKFVAEQPKALQKLAGEAAKQVGSQFDELDTSVNEKQSALVDDLADKYAEARNAVDEDIKKLQADNKGLVGQAVDAIGGAVETIKKLKDMLLGVLARAANAVDTIIKDPMAFLEKFGNAVKAGITGFMSNIVTHLKKGLQSWLFGTLAEAGIEIPEKFDLKGIITLLMSLLGLTWNSIRARIVKVVGERAMGFIEKGVDFIKVIVTEGLPGVWKFIAEKLTDLKDQVMGQIKDFVITKVITAGVTWLISLLNPAAAFIKACKMIYDAVMWFVDNAERLKDFVDSVLDSVESIAAGGVGKVAALIESTMAKTIPMLISGLASLLGLGGIANKIKDILEKVQAPVGKAVDWLVGKAVKYGKKFIDKLKKSKLGKAAAAVKDKAKAAYATGKAYVKKKYEAGKAWVKDKYDKGKKWVKGKAEQLGSFLKNKCNQLLQNTFSTNFTADKQSHRLYTNPGAADTLYVASTPQKLVAAFSHLKSASVRSEIADLDGKFRYRMRLYRDKVKALSKRGEDWAAKNPAGVKAALTDINSVKNDAAKIQAAIVEFARKNMKAKGGPGAHAPGIGNIAPHAAQVPRLRNGGVELWQMESEHIIPDGLLRRALMTFTRNGNITKADTVYSAQSTILLYRGAAKEKTGGTPVDARPNQDQDLIIRMGNVTAMVRARAGGNAEWLRKDGVTRPGTKVEPKRYWRSYLEDQYERRIKPLFKSLSDQALSRTKVAVKAEQKLVGDGRGAGAPPRPTDSELESAQNAQRAHMEQIIEQHLKNSDFA
jgi:hypothetical protein